MDRWIRIFSNKPAQRIILLMLVPSVIFTPWGNSFLQWFGRGVQQVCVQSAGGLLGIFYRVHVEGLRMLLCGKDILPDQPISSAKMMLIPLVLFVLLAKMRRPKTGQAIMGFCSLWCWVYVANTARIFILASGKAFPNLVGHVDVSAPFWHDGIGWLCLLFFGLLPVLVGCGKWETRQNRKDTVSAVKLLAPAEALPQQFQSKPRSFSSRLKIWLACLPVACALVLVTSPVGSFENETAKQFHTSSIKLDAHYSPKHLLSPLESAYLNQFGARAIRLRVGSHLILSIQVSAFNAPLVSQIQGVQYVCRLHKLPKKRYC